MKNGKKSAKQGLPSRLPQSNAMPRRKWKWRRRLRREKTKKYTGGFQSVADFNYEAYKANVKKLGIVEDTSYEPSLKFHYDPCEHSHCYVAIDLKAFYASIECVSRGLHPLKANLVVADNSRTDKTICLAVTPSLKALGVSGRPRLFEVKEQIRKVNADRESEAGKTLTESSTDGPTLAENPALAVDYLVARPQMALYMNISARIYRIYLRYVAPEDILVYSVDEVFMDVTGYLKVHGMEPEQLARRMVYDVLCETGITATAGIGTNLYLCKIAMDIQAKHTKADSNGVRIAYLDEDCYRRLLWTHEPITDFWRVGPGIAKRLGNMGIYTMGDIAMCSLHSEERLYKEFGINAELLIDHAWGWEPCTLADVKSYFPSSNSLSSGQVLQEPYDHTKCRLIVKEMIELMTLDFVKKGVETDQIVLTIGYDVENLSDPKRAASYIGAIEIDRYGRKIPKHSQGTANLGGHTSSTDRIAAAVMELYDRISDPNLLVRRVNLSANHIVKEGSAFVPETEMQTDLFSVPAMEEEQKRAEAKEKVLQKTMLSIREKYGSNAILKGMNLEEGATTVTRNRQIGGHNA